MKYCFENIKKVPIWRLIFGTFWLLSMPLGMWSQDSTPPSFQEMVINRLNDVTVFTFFFILLLLVADLGFSQDGISAESKRSSFWHQVGYGAFLSFFIIALYMIFCLVIMLILGGSVSFSNEWNTIEPFGFEWASPTLAMLIIIPLFFLRLVFLVCLIAAVNSRCKKAPYGYTAGFAVCLLNSIVCFHFMLTSTGGIFPFEHANLESVFALTPNVPLSIFISVLYWLLIIAATGLIYRSGNLGKGVD